MARVLVMGPVVTVIVQLIRVFTILVCADIGAEIVD